MISKSKLKSKKIPKRSNPNKIIDNFMILLDNRAEKASNLGNIELANHLAVLMSNIEKDIQWKVLDPSSKKTILKYLKDKKSVIENAIDDLISKV